jgi:hypothetical protein
MLKHHLNIHSVCQMAKVASYFHFSIGPLVFLGKNTTPYVLTKSLKQACVGLNSICRLEQYPPHQLLLILNDLAGDIRIVSSVSP